MRTMSLLSIVIANYNYGRFIETAIRSVVDQCYGVEKCTDGIARLRIGNGFYAELIICDAASSDNSIDIIRKYNDKITWWCSEKDNGQSDAFNKGFSHASGKYLTWLNADDLLMPNFFNRFIKVFEKNSDCEWFAGGCVNVDNELKILKCTLARRFSCYDADCGSLCVYSPSSIFSRNLLNKVGGVNINYRGAMDTHLWNKFYRYEGVCYKLLPGYIFAFRFHEESRTTCNKFVNSIDKARYERLCREFANDMRMLREEFPKRRRASIIGRVVHLDWVRWILSKIDTLIYKGRSITEI